MEIGNKRIKTNKLSFRPVVRYIVWFYVAVLVGELLVGGIYSIYTMQREAGSTLESAKAQLDYRINNTVALLRSLTGDYAYIDPSTTYKEKAVELKRYSDEFGYMMICIVDGDVNVYNERDEHSNANLGGRDYMQRLFATGKVQVTDSFAAGADGVTLNYTIAAPIMNNDKVDGCIFAAIYFDEISQILERRSTMPGQTFSLLGSKNQIMSTSKGDLYGKNIIELSSDKRFFGTTTKELEENMFNGLSGEYWSLGNGSLTYVAYAPIENTSWTLMSRLDFAGVVGRYMPQLLGLMLLSTIACIVLVFLSNRYIKSQMGLVDMLVGSVQELEKKIYQNEKPDDLDFKEIISLTSKGLTDGLTGVITRTVFLNQAPNKLKLMKDNTISAICFVDVDNLKNINDKYGHAVGDMTLKNVGYVLREYEKKYDGLVGRYGGDEFIMLLMGFETRELLDDILEEMTARLHSHVSTGEAVLPTQCSIGVSICTNPTDNIEQLIATADKTLYFVKQSGKGRYQIFNAEP